jgi:hypothetical protein
MNSIQLSQWADPDPKINVAQKKPKYVLRKNKSIYQWSLSGW